MRPPTTCSTVLLLLLTIQWETASPFRFGTRLARTFGLVRDAVARNEEEKSFVVERRRSFWSSLWRTRGGGGNDPEDRNGRHKGRRRPQRSCHNSKRSKKGKRRSINHKGKNSNKSKGLGRKRRRRSTSSTEDYLHETTKRSTTTTSAVGEERRQEEAVVDQPPMYKSSDGSQTRSKRKRTKTRSSKTKGVRKRRKKPAFVDRPPPASLKKEEDSFENLSAMEQTRTPLPSQSLNKRRRSSGSTRKRKKRKRRIAPPREEATTVENVDMAGDDERDDRHDSISPRKATTQAPKRKRKRRRRRKAKTLLKGSKKAKAEQTMPQQQIPEETETDAIDAKIVEGSQLPSKKRTRKKRKRRKAKTSPASIDTVVVPLEAKTFVGKTESNLQQETADEPTPEKATPVVQNAGEVTTDKTQVKALDKEVTVNVVEEDIMTGVAPGDKETKIDDSDEHVVMEQVTKQIDTPQSEKVTPLTDEEENKDPKPVGKDSSELMDTQRSEKETPLTEKDMEESKDPNPLEKESSVPVEEGADAGEEDPGDHKTLNADKDIEVEEEEEDSDDDIKEAITEAVGTLRELEDDSDDEEVMIEKAEEHVDNEKLKEMEEGSEDEDSEDEYDDEVEQPGDKSRGNGDLEDPVGAGVVNGTGSLSEAMETNVTQPATDSKASASNEEVRQEDPTNGETIRTNGSDETTSEDMRRPGPAQEPDYSTESDELDIPIHVDEVEVTIHVDKKEQVSVRLGDRSSVDSNATRATTQNTKQQASRKAALEDDNDEDEEGTLPSNQITTVSNSTAKKSSDGAIPVVTTSGASTSSIPSIAKPRTTFSLETQKKAPAVTNASSIPKSKEGGSMETWADPGSLLDNRPRVATEIDDSEEDEDQDDEEEDEDASEDDDSEDNEDETHDVKAAKTSFSSSSTKNLSFNGGSIEGSESSTSDDSNALNSTLSKKSEEQEKHDMLANDGNSSATIPTTKEKVSLEPETRASDMKVSVVTWNLAESSPAEEEASFFRQFRGSDLVLISGQECENIKPRRTEGHRSREFRRLMIKMLGKKFVPLGLHMLGGIQFGLFCRRSFLQKVEFVSIADVTCGIGNVFHNKGAIAAFVQVKASNDGVVGDVKRRAKSIKMLFVTGHLAAHVKNTEARDADFWRVVQELESQAPPRFLPPNPAAMEGITESRRDTGGSGSYLLDSMDRVFFCGDLNYRINLPREETEYTITQMQKYPEEADKLRERLLRHDQLLATMAEGNAFTGLCEGKITFLPTFKFDKGTDEYDTSHKQRIPAWTDRVLFKPSGTRLLRYNSVPDALHSDHRPVFASFQVSRLGSELPPARKRKRSRRRSWDED